MRANLLTPAGLVLGLALGLLGGWGGVEWARAFARAWCGPVGRIFLAFVQMAVIPLVAATVILSVVRLGDVARLGRIGLRFVAVLAATLLVAGICGVVVGSALLPVVSLSPESAANLRQAAAASAPAAGVAPSFAEFLVALVPTNPLKAAADGALLPLVLFCLLFGLALARIEAEPKGAVVAFLEGIAVTMGRIFEWALRLAPVGVFALAAASTAEVGPDILASLGWFVVVVLVALAAFVAVGILPAVRVVARVGIDAFERAALPAQTVAFASTSSLASLPALLEGGKKGLGLRAEVSDLVLPLAASIYRSGSAVFMAVSALFVARLYGVEVSAGSLMAVVFAAALASVSVPPVAYGSFAAMAPVLTAAGAPVAGMWVLFAVDRFPDMCRTTVNVTGSLAAAAVVARPRNAEPRR